MRCYGEVWYEGRVSLSAPRDHECWCDPTVAAFCESKIAKVAPAFYKMVQDDDVEAWFKMQVWMLQYLSRDFKESDGAIIDAHDPEIFQDALA